MRLSERLRGWLPTHEQIHGSRWLSWLGPRLLHPKLWHWSRRGVALGVAVGVFFGLLMPIAQIPVSVTAAVLLRANVPAAAASTLVTNPLTFGPVYYAAYRLGAWVTGHPQAAAVEASAPAEVAADTGLWQRVGAVGKPLLAGLVISATLMGALTYMLVTLVWRWRILSRRRRRSR